MSFTRTVCCTDIMVDCYNCASVRLRGGGGVITQGIPEHLHGVLLSFVCVFVFWKMEPASSLFFVVVVAAAHMFCRCGEKL